MCVESDGCELEACSSSDEVRTLSGSMSEALKPSARELGACSPGQKCGALLMRLRSPTAAAGILSFGNVLNYMDRYTVAGKSLYGFFLPLCGALACARVPDQFVPSHGQAGRAL